MFYKIITHFSLQNSLKMSTLQLIRKSNSVVEAYSHLFDKFLPEVTSSIVEPLDEKDLLLFNSMERQHKNSHTTAEDWLALFDQIKSKLGTKETMTLSVDFIKFLDLKFAASDLRKQFHTPDMLDHLDKVVRKNYRDLLFERDQEEDEFDFHIVDGIKPEDTTFFTKRFLPAALFFTYILKHPMSDPKELMGELFSLGSGSMTFDLFPEITGVCPDCIVERFQSEKFVNLSFEQIRQVNKIVFRAQQADCFVTKTQYLTDSSDEEEATEEIEDLDDSIKSAAVSLHLSESKSLISEDLFEFNPFVLNSGSLNNLESENVEDEVSLSHACIHCSKAFSREEFVNMHIEIFHGSVRKVVPRFVSEGEELITSFVEHNDKEISTQNVKKVKNLLKFNKRNK